MSYEEKNTAVSLASHLLILGYYLFNLYSMFQKGTIEVQQVLNLAAICIAATIFVNIIAIILTNILLTIFEAIQNKKYEEPRFIADERDQMIGLKGMRIAYAFFSIGVAIAVVSFGLGQSATIMVTEIIFFAITAQIVEDITKIVLYRRGL